MADNKELAARLLIAANIHEDMTGSANAMAATFREAAAALTATPSAQGDASPEVRNALEKVNAAANFARHNGNDDEANALVKARITLHRAALTPRTDEPAPTVDGGAVGKVIEGFADALGCTAYVAKWSGDPPSVGTKLYTHPAPAPDVARLVEAWIADGDTIPQPIIKATREAICLEFGNSGTDGYYKRILVRVFRALTAQPEGATNGQE